MDVTWLVDEYLGNGKVRHAAFSSKRRAIEVAGKSCDHSSKVILVEWTYCRPLSVQQLFPVRTDPVVYESSSDVIKRKTAINAKGFAGVYGCTDFVGAGHTSRIAAEKRKEKRRARRSVKQALHQGVYDF